MWFAVGIPSDWGIELLFDDIRAACAYEFEGGFRCVFYCGMNPSSGPRRRCQFASSHSFFTTAYFPRWRPEFVEQVADCGGGMCCDAGAGEGAAKADRGFAESTGEIRDGMTRVKEFLDAGAGSGRVNLAPGCQLLGGDLDSGQTYRCFGPDPRRCNRRLPHQPADGALGCPGDLDDLVEADAVLAEELEVGAGGASVDVRLPAAAAQRCGSMPLGGPVRRPTWGASATVRDIGHTGAMPMWCSRMSAVSAVTAGSVGPIPRRGMRRCRLHAHTSVSSEGVHSLSGSCLLYNLSTE